MADLLADGSRAAAHAIGHNSIAIAPQVKGLEMPGYEPRALQTMALGFAVGARGADHNRSGAYEVDFSDKVDRRHVTLDAVRHAIDTEDRAALMDSLIICKFLRGVFEDFHGETAAMLRSVTGWDVTADELRETATRIVAAKREFNLLAGWTPAEDTLPERFLEYAAAQRCRGAPQPRAARRARGGIPPATRLVERYAKAGVSERRAVVLRRVEVPQRPELRIDDRHLLRLHAARAHGVEEEHRPQPVTGEERFDVRERVAPVDRRERMRKAVDFHDRDIVIAHQLDHALDKRGHQQWHVAARDVGRIDRLRQRAQAGADAFKRSLRLALVARDDDRIWQRRQRLLAGGNDDDGGDHRAEKADHALQHGFGSEGQRGFGHAHPGRLTAAQNDAADGHASSL